MRTFTLHIKESTEPGVGVEIVADLDGGKDTATEQENRAAFVIGSQIKMILRNPKLCIAHGEGKTMDEAVFRRDIGTDIEKAGQ